MKNNDFSVMIASADSSFRNRVKSIFENPSLATAGRNFSIFEPSSFEEMETEAGNHEPEIVFIDSAFLPEKNGRIIQMLKSIKVPNQLILVISNGGARSQETIEYLEKNRSVYLSGHILKGQFSTELLTVMIRFFIRKTRK